MSVGSHQGCDEWCDTWFANVVRQSGATKWFAKVVRQSGATKWFAKVVQHSGHNRTRVRLDLYSEEAISKSPSLRCIFAAESAYLYSFGWSDAARSKASRAVQLSPSPLARRARELYALASERGEPEKKKGHPVVEKKTDIRVVLLWLK